jgi:hypothetical protein
MIMNDYEHLVNLSDCEIFEQFMNESEDQSMNEIK